MANRVTHAELIEVFSTDIEDTTPFITTANLIVTDKLAGEGFTDAHLKEIEKYLSAHFASLMDPRIAQEKIGEVAVTYEGKTGLGLDGTKYGQTVKMLDTTGILASMGKRQALFDTLG